jgi:hypothetical protein
VRGKPRQVAALMIRPGRFFRAKSRSIKLQLGLWTIGSLRHLVQGTASCRGEEEDRSIPIARNSRRKSGNIVRAA